MGITDHSPRRGIKVEKNPGKGNRLKKKALFKSGYMMPTIFKGAAALVGIAVVCVIIGAVFGGRPAVLAADVLVGQENGAVPCRSGGAGRHSPAPGLSATGSDSEHNGLTSDIPGGTASVENSDGTGDETSGRYTVIFDFYGRDSVSCTTGAATVGEIADKLGISFDENEVLNVDTDMLVTKDTVVSADLVTYGTVSVSEPVDYGTSYVDVQNIPLGSTRLVSEGIEGEKVTEYECTYVNGEEVMRVPGSSYITRDPVDRVVSRGVGGTFTGGDGGTYRFSYYIDVRATVYYSGGICATGVPADESVIAVDPSVIPLGSRVYITGSYADIGVRTAADTGGSIKGNIIDICLNSSNPLAGSFGFRPMRVYILN